MRRWRSVYGAVVGAGCHPPANAAGEVTWHNARLAGAAVTEEWHD